MCSGSVRLTAITRDGHSVDYGYDRFGRTTQDGELSFTFDRNGNRTGIGYPGGVTATYGHDFADRQTSLSVTTASGTTPVVTRGPPGSHQLLPPELRRVGTTSFGHRGLLSPQP